MDDVKKRHLKTMGIDYWVAKEKPNTDVSAAQADKMPVVDPSIPVCLSPDDTPSDLSLTEIGWEELEKRVAGCIACGLHKTRTQTVFGIGNRHADLLIVGDGYSALAGDY